MGSPTTSSPPFSCATDQTNSPSTLEASKSSPKTTHDFTAKAPNADGTSRSRTKPPERSLSTSECSGLREAASATGTTITWLFLMLQIATLKLYNCANLGKFMWLQETRTL